MRRTEIRSDSDLVSGLDSDSVQVRWKSKARISAVVDGEDDIHCPMAMVAPVPVGIKHAVEPSHSPTLTQIPCPPHHHTLNHLPHCPTTHPPPAPPHPPFCITIHLQSILGYAVALIPFIPFIPFIPPAHPIPLQKEARLNP